MYLFTSQYLEVIFHFCQKICIMEIEILINMKLNVQNMQMKLQFFRNSSVFLFKCLYNLFFSGLAQQDCHLWVSRVQRSSPIRKGQVYSYPSRRWRVRKRPDFIGTKSKMAEKQKSEEESQGSAIVWDIVYYLLSLYR